MSFTPFDAVSDEELDRELPLDISDRGRDADCAIRRFSAAWVMLPASATATKYLSCVSVKPCPLGISLDQHIRMHDIESSE